MQITLLANHTVFNHVFTKVHFLTNTIQQMYIFVQVSIQSVYIIDSSGCFFNICLNHLKH